jgi:hypothetical protein
MKIKEKKTCPKTNQMKIGVDSQISEKVDRQKKNMTKDKEVYCNHKRHQKVITILDPSACNSIVLKYLK